ncbi:glycosyltransferase family A protein [Corticibacterium sp. UT-5YL-CI-8]|nr:glycosyltransferase family A protein [Tianweitania sp. UT-5YL-CI-8]
MNFSSQSFRVAYPPDDVSNAEIGEVQDSGSLMLSTSLKVVAKSSKDLSAIRVAPGAASSQGCSLQWRGLASYVRLYLDISSLGRLSGWNYTLACELVLSLVPSGGPVLCDWIAILRQDENGAFLFHRKIEDRVRFAPGDTRRSWALQLTSEEMQEAGRLVIAIHCSAAEAKFDLEHFGIRVQSLETRQATFTAWVGGVVEGWTRTDEAALWLSPATDGADEEVNFPLNFGRFSRLSPAISDAQAPIAAHVVSGGDIVAYLDLTCLPTNLRPPEVIELADPEGSISPLIAEWLHERGKVELLWMLGDGMGGPHLSEPARHAFALYGARALLDINAVESAYQGLLETTGDNIHFQAMPPAVRRKMRLSFVRACVRSGRPREAEQILRDMLLADPLDWECYFQLAILAVDVGSASRLTNLQIADALNQKLSTAMLVVILEDLLARGRVDEAWVRALRELKLRGERGRELWLTLGNIHLARGDLRNWSASVRRLFAEMELAEPEFHIFRDPAEDVFHRLEVSANLPEPVQTQDDLISVVMTTYNAEHTVKRAVRSVLAQSYRNLRLIIVDDCSTDDTMALLRHLQTQDSRIEILQTPFNVGTYCAKNMALERFESDYFTFHDSDDWMHPERLAIHHRYMKEAPHVLCTTSRWYRMDTRGIAIPRQGGGYLHDNPGSAFFHKSVIERIGYFDSVRVGADTELAGRIRRCFGSVSVQIIAKPLAIGLHHSASLTRSGATAFDEYRYSALRVAYWESWIEWQRRTASKGGGTADFYVPFPHHIRSFPAPAGIVPERVADLEPAGRAKDMGRLRAVS